MRKILLIRFSSIGDIVLTTPVIRCIKQQVPGAEVHFLTKNAFKPVLEHNPHIDRLWTTDGSLNDVLPELKKQGFEAIVDLHNNLRSRRVRMALGVKATAFNKLNFEKWLLVNLKVDRMPHIHIVDRYLQAAAHLGVKNDLRGLDYFVAPDQEVDLQTLPEAFRKDYVACVIGAKHATKMMPAAKIASILKQLGAPVVLLGGPEDAARGDEIVAQAGPQVLNACGKYKLGGSASLVKQAKAVLTHDTGLMHIAAAFQKPIVSLWGNTVPALGMTPYEPQHPQQVIISEVKGLSCRPCSKIGYQQCPKKHFKCMLEQDEAGIVAGLRGFLGLTPYPLQRRG